MKSKQERPRDPVRPKLLDASDLLPVVEAWGRENRVTRGALAGMCSEVAERLVDTNEDGSLRQHAVPTSGIVCHGYWSPQHQMQWRSVDLASGEVLVENQAEFGSVNVACFLGTAQTIELLEEQERTNVRIWCADYVPYTWVKKRLFNTTGKCSEWVREFVSRFNSTDYALRERLQLWDHEQWGPPPGMFGGKDYRQKWRVK